MATSTLYQSSALGSSSGSPRSCLYLSRPKADWHASFTKRESCGRPPTMPLILRQHDGVWLPSINNTSSHTKEPTPQPQPETPSTPPMTAEDNVTMSPKSRLSLARVSKTLRCHVCQATIREQHFQNHLFFGMVRCDLCNWVCRDCRSFAQLKEDTSLRYSSCRHSFSYTEDPFEYLLPRLSGSDDIDVGGSLTLPNKLRVLQHYINQLISVQLQEPWCTAVRKCKSRLFKFHTVMPPEASKDLELLKHSLETNADPLPVEDSANSSPATLTKSDACDNSLRMAPEGFTCPSPAQQESQENDTDDGVLLTQTYDLEHLEQAVEYVELDEQCKLDGVQDRTHIQRKSKKRRKAGEYKRLKAHRLRPQQRRRQSSIVPALPEEDAGKKKDESDLVMEDVALPQDGYYLMVQEAVEECPMCYTSFSPNHCSVNLKTFLFTVSCSHCGLLIYIVPDIPGGLQIVTDSSAMTESKQINHKTSRKVRPKDFFAR